MSDNNFAMSESDDISDNNVDRCSHPTKYLYNILFLHCSLAAQSERTIEIMKPKSIKNTTTKPNKTGLLWTSFRSKITKMKHCRDNSEHRVRYFSRGFLPKCFKMIRFKSWSSILSRPSQNFLDRYNNSKVMNSNMVLTHET